MTTSSPWRPTLIVTSLALAAWVGAGILNTAILFSGRSIPAVQVLLQTMPPVGRSGISLMAAVVMTVLFTLALLLLLRALFGGTGVSGAPTFLGTWGATFVALAVAGLLYAVLSVTVLGFYHPSHGMLPVWNMFAGRLLPGLWLGPVLGLVALGAHRRRPVPNYQRTDPYLPGSGPVGTVGQDGRGE